MISVRESMSTNVHSIGADQPLEVAHAMMRKHGIRHLPVLRGGKLAGMLSDRDLRFLESFPGVDPSQVRVEEAMSLDVYAVEPSAALADVASTMAEHKYGSAVVIEGGKVVGMLTTTDLCRILAALLRGSRQR
jgi:acetoin utilization protein AcuB